jgi:hypothetical protein
MTVFSEVKTFHTDAVELVCVITLLVLLILKEFASSSDSEFALTFRRILNIGIVPLLMAFVLLVVVRIAQIL